MDLQIDEFYKDCAAGLLQLYLVFPRRTALYVEDLIGLEEPDEFGLPSKRHQSCLGALLWLADEGYLRFDSTIRYEALDQAELSDKGFLRLARTVPGVLPQLHGLPAAVQRVQSTLAWQLRQALSGGHSEQIVRLTRLLFESTLDGDSDTV